MRRQRAACEAACAYNKHGRPQDEGEPDEARDGHYQAVQARGSPLGADRSRAARHDRDRSQRLWAAKGAHGNLPRGGIRGELPAQDQDRGGGAGGDRGQGGRGHRAHRPHGSDRRRQNLRVIDRTRGPRPHGRNRRQRHLTYGVTTTNTRHQEAPLMSLGLPRRIATLAVTAFIVTLAAPAALAQRPGPRRPNKGDVPWMLRASVSALLMPVPGVRLSFAALAG